MSKPGKPPEPTPLRGRFVGLVRVAKEKYRVEILTVEGDRIVNRIDFETGAPGLSRGSQSQGASLPIALYALNTAVAKYIRTAEVDDKVRK